MTIDRLRHGRQIRLPEIGEAGQARLYASEVVAGAVGDAREIEVAYLARAGVKVAAEIKAGGKTKPGASQADVKEHADLLASFGIADSAARDVADGSLRALLIMRRILGLENG